MFTLYITTQAKEHLKRQSLKDNSKNIFSFGVKPSGCSGFAWNIEKINQEEATKRVINGIGSIYHDHGFDYFVATKDEIHLNESVVELEKEGLNQKLKVKNPQAINHCGCGESFGLNTAKSTINIAP